MLALPHAPLGASIDDIDPNLLAPAKSTFLHQKFNDGYNIVDSNARQRDYYHEYYDHELRRKIKAELEEAETESDEEDDCHTSTLETKGKEYKDLKATMALGTGNSITVREADGHGGFSSATYTRIRTGRRRSLGNKFRKWKGYFTY